MWSSDSNSSVALSGSRLAAGLHRQYGRLGPTAPDAARLFRLLGLLSVPYVDDELAAALAGTSRGTAEMGLRQLVDAGLLRNDGQHYRMTPFHRRFAEGMAREVDAPAERKAALEAAFRHLLERDDAWGHRIRSTHAGPDQHDVPPTSELNLAAALKAQGRTDEMTIAYVAGLERLRELARYGLASSQREEDTEPAALPRRDERTGRVMPALDKRRS